MQDGSEACLNTGVRFNFTRQGFVNLAWGRGHEAWKGQRFTVGRDVNFFGQMQAFPWLYVNNVGVGDGPAIFCADVDPFQGRSFSSNIGVTIQPNQHLTQDINYDMVRFDRADNGVRVFGVDIVNSKSTYQFDKHFLVRFLAQFDSSAKRVLTDLPASYELVPGTVSHAGYGSLYERRLDREDGFVPVNLGENYVAVNRGLFFKASYLRRF